MREGENNGERASVPSQEAPRAPAQARSRAWGKEILGEPYYLP